MESQKSDGVVNVPSRGVSNPSPVRSMRGESVTASGAPHVRGRSFSRTRTSPRGQSVAMPYGYSVREKPHNFSDNVSVASQSVINRGMSIRRGIKKKIAIVKHVLNTPEKLKKMSRKQKSTSGCSIIEINDTPEKMCPSVKVEEGAIKSPKTKGYQKRIVGHLLAEARKRRASIASTAKAPLSGQSSNSQRTVEGDVNTSYSPVISCDYAISSVGHSPVKSVKDICKERKKALINANTPVRHSPRNTETKCATKKSPSFAATKTLSLTKRKIVMPELQQRQRSSPGKVTSSTPLRNNTNKDQTILNGTTFSNRSKLSLTSSVEKASQHKIKADVDSLDMCPISPVLSISQTSASSSSEPMPDRIDSDCGETDCVIILD